ncbi:MAG: hypothetical protein IPN20_09810 [Haliscomenobacter sp.]|nr:hypothetical protein [Haliscomenobacter sp.]MBK8654178.1 hypothetical protein [Haliscomenobacter sp.]
MVSITKIPARQWAKMVKALPPALKEEVMSTYDMILQEGIEQGIQQGKEKNVKEVVLRGYHNGVSYEVLCLLTGLSEEEVKAIIAQHGEEEKRG